MYGLSKVLGTGEDRPRGARGRGRRRGVQLVLPGRGRPDTNGDIDGRATVEEAQPEACAIRLATRDGRQISVRGPKVGV